MAKKRIDRERVYRLLMMGLTVKEIAWRMKCSERQITRIKTRELGILGGAPKDYGVKYLRRLVADDEEIETAVQRAMHRVGMSLEEIGEILGKSKQGVYKSLTDGGFSDDGILHRNNTRM